MRHQLYETYKRLFKETPGGQPVTGGDAEVEKFRDLDALRNSLDTLDPYDFVEQVSTILSGMGANTLREIGRLHGIRRFTDSADLSRQLAEKIFAPDTWYSQGSK